MYVGGKRTQEAENYWQSFLFLPLPAMPLSLSLSGSGTSWKPRETHMSCLSVIRHKWESSRVSCRVRVENWSVTEWVSMCMMVVRCTAWSSALARSLAMLEGPCQVRACHSTSMPVTRDTLYPESSSTVRPFNEIPGMWKNSLGNLYTFWKLNGFKNIHHIMVHNFNTFGPIYR